MKRIYVSADPIECGFFESILTERGINCLVRNRYLGGAIGELPLNEAWPEIWVVDECDAELAKRVINEAQTPARHNAGAWQCEHCGEMMEAQFTQCWQCTEE